MGISIEQIIAREKLIRPKFSINAAIIALQAIKADEIYNANAAQLITLQEEMNKVSAAIDTSITVKVVEGIHE